MSPLELFWARAPVTAARAMALGRVPRVQRQATCRRRASTYFFLGVVAAVALTRLQGVVTFSSASGAAFRTHIPDARSRRLGATVTRRAAGGVAGRVDARDVEPLGSHVLVQVIDIQKGPYGRSLKDPAAFHYHGFVGIG